MPAELEVLTINLWGLPWPIARDRPERKRRFLDHVSAAAYDLVGIQELWWPWRRALRRAPLWLPRSWRDSGLALAGRLRVRDEPRVEHFGAHAGFDRLKRKGVLRAGVEAAGAALAVYVTHLQAGRRHALVRTRQVEELLRILARERCASLVMGDFNLHAGVEADERSAERLRGAGLVDAALALSRDEPTYQSTNPYARRRSEERFDRVYLRAAQGVGLDPVDVEVLRVAPRPLSDHHPVRVRVRVSG